eukprot:Em0531g9a
MHEKSSPSVASKKEPQKETLNPKDARAQAKKLIETGKLQIPENKSAAKKSGFKRVGEVTQKGPPAKKANTTTGDSTGAGQAPVKLTRKEKMSEVKALYNRFVKAADSDDLAGHKIPKRLEPVEVPEEPKHGKFTTMECSIHVVGDSLLSEEAMVTAFSRFGDIATVLPDQSKGACFLTFALPSVAITAVKEMDGGMIRGTVVHVECATPMNGYVELTPEAAAIPWVRLAAGRELPTSESRKKRDMVVYEADF